MPATLAILVFQSSDFSRGLIARPHGDLSFLVS